MKCARCEKEIEAGYFGSFSKQILCDTCYGAQVKVTIQEAVSPTGDKEPVATGGVTLDKVEPAVKEAIE